MSAILNFFSAHNFSTDFNEIVSKSMVYRALSYKTHLMLGLQSPLR